MRLLELDGVEAGYGRVKALHGVSLAVGEGEAVALLGANGAGKSTLLRTVIGLLPASAGAIRFGGGDITAWRPDRRARLGLGYVPEGRRVFPGLSVRDNLLVACRGGPSERARRLERVCTLFPALAELEAAASWQLSGGQQQMLTIGRALMSGPRLLLLDEPSLGLAPVVAREMFAAVRRIAGEGCGVLVAEQSQAALAVCERAVVLRVGRIVREGRAADMTDLRADYL
jgi:branched-chain amino acid transport system ATP-binding protein